MFVCFLYPLIGCWDISADSSFAIVNTATINISMQVSLLYIDLHFFGYMPKSGTVGS
jgi:hypothetical protein